MRVMNQLDNTCPEVEMTHTFRDASN